VEDEGFKAICRMPRVAKRQSFLLTSCRGILAQNQDIFPNIPSNKKGEDLSRSRTSGQLSGSDRAPGRVGRTHNRLLQSVKTCVADPDPLEFGWTIFRLLANCLSIKRSKKYLTLLGEKK
jgi:hypothetical protein